MSKAKDIFQKLQAGERLPAAVQLCRAPDAVDTRDMTDESKTIKIHAKALSKDVMEDPTLGRVIYDFGTMRCPQRLALDDTHGDEVGYFRTARTEYGLEAEGVVCPNQLNEQHASNRIAYNLRNGIPQQFSIDWRGPFDVAYVPEGETAQVNGLEVSDCFIIQNWTVRAGAICKVGKDGSTSVDVQLNSAASELAPLPGKVALISKAKKMTQQNSMVTDAQKLEIAAACSNVSDKASACLSAMGTQDMDAYACIKLVLDSVKTAGEAVADNRENADGECYEAAYACRNASTECAELNLPEADLLIVACVKAANTLYSCCGSAMCLYAEKHGKPQLNIAPKGAQQNNMKTPEQITEEAKQAKAVEAAQAEAKAKADLEVQQNAAKEAEAKAVEAKVAEAKKQWEEQQQNANKANADQLNAANAKLAELEERILALGKAGAAPVPGAGKGEGQQLSWSQAVEQTRIQMNSEVVTPMVFAAAVKKFPELQKKMIVHKTK